MDRLAVPADLNGTLVTVLLPLRAEFTPALTPGSVQGQPYEEPDAFLASRAEFVAPTFSRSWADATDHPRYDAWGDPVLLACSQRAISARPVTFGRSASTVAESSDGDQPLVHPESAAASLWLVSGLGLVLALERLNATHDLAQTTDAVGRLLRKPVPGAGRKANQYFVPDAAKGVVEALEFMGIGRDTGLVDLFPTQVDDLANVVGITVPISDVLVPSRAAQAGHQLIEGLVVGLGAAEQSSALGINSLLFRRIEGDDLDFDASHEWQEVGYRWDYEPFHLATEPAREDAPCAMRSDGRVAVVDIDALSIYHDYLGLGGTGIVRALVPLAAMAGQVAADQADVVDHLQHLAAAGAVDDALLSDGLGLARRVRARLELRNLQQAQLLGEKNFRAWTIDESLRREMAPRAMRDQFSSDGTSISEGLRALGRSVASLEAALERRADEVAVVAERRRAEGQQQVRSIVSLVSGVVAAAGLVAVFTSLASVPGPAERAVPSLATAGLWTVFSLAALALLGGVGFVFVEGRRALPGRRTQLALGLLVLAGIGSGAGLLAVPEVQSTVLSIVCAAVAAASVLAVLDLRAHRRPPGAKG